MSIDEEQLDYLDYVKNEVRTLGIISSLTSIESTFSSLSNVAEILYGIYSGKDMTVTDFTFGCELKMEVESDFRSVLIEAIVKKDFTLATYAFSVCDTILDEKSLIRKFHFDYDPQKNANFYSKKPRYHLQYGGKATPKLKELGVGTEALHEWLSVPRISLAPINLAILLDIAFNEFPSEDTKKITEDSLWRDMIKTNCRLPQKLGQLKVEYSG